ncbi:peptidase family M1-domain-containing protein [Polychytrium aggregatum]|uniref:peptidase family M1-domain-containing protein n=1 Tax=Polychytrium aggregatum TaxID=110093 RepID=UPI0022FE295E|nr:peptidase family M1-domain-containing protein [Polychytrium aggregatum]KAI9206593.1 peptidase family M1-domain-containing protein [Polychytrium aggregatum]
MTQREVLPTTVRPVHYLVSLTPALQAPFVYSGSVVIRLHVNETTSSVICNADKLAISSASISGVNLKTEFSQVATSISYDEALQRATFTFAQPLQAGTQAELKLIFTGEHNDQLSGFYRSTYKDQDGSDKFLVSTHFEPVGARRAFPCWDEPGLKAKFDVKLTIDRELSGLSNTHVVAEKDVVVDGAPKRELSFATSPLMSTYLIAFCVGELEFIEAIAHPTKPAAAKPVTVRVYTVPGNKETGRFALELGARTVEYFSEYFDMPYPLEKLDLIAIPDFPIGGMENWGLITFRTSALLFDPKASTATKKQMVSSVVCHEIAHMWFGNLVTMEWWSDLWLKEGFATYVGEMAVDHFYPDWHIWSEFLDSFLSAQKLDALRSSHPIEVPVTKASDIAQIFDQISYEKGASIIRMLASFLGRETFMNGVRAYLKKHQFSNTTTDDLWSSLNDASGKDVQGLMHAWTRRVGYPVVSVLSESYDPVKKELTIHVRQNRFLSSGAAPESEDTTLWAIPLLIVTHLSPNSPTQHVLAEREAVITLPYDDSADSFFKLNYQTTSFFRTNLPASSIERLGSAIAKNIDAISVDDRTGLLSDVFALAEAGYVPTTDALRLLENFDKENSFIVMVTIVDKLVLIKNAFYREDPAIVAALQKLQLHIFAKKARELGIIYSPDDSHITTRTRTLVIGAAVGAGDESLRKEYERLFEEYIGGNTEAIPSDLLPGVFAVTLAHSKHPERDFERVFNLFRTTKSDDVRLAALRAFGHPTETSLISRVLGYTLDSEVLRSQDVTQVIATLALRNNNPLVARPLVWNWIVSQWEAIYEKFSASHALWAIFGFAIETLIGDEYVKAILDWSEGADLAPEQRARRQEQVQKIQMVLNQKIETIRSTTAYVDKNREGLLKWAQEARV